MKKSLVSGLKSCLSMVQVGSLPFHWSRRPIDVIPGFSPCELDRLSQLRIVPKTVSGHREWLPPVQCYVGGRMGHDFYSKLFHFVNFGPMANRFLNACGAKIEPSEKDVVESLIDDPERFYELAGGHEQ